MPPEHPKLPCLDAIDRGTLAAAVGDRPETVIAVHPLRRGLARATVLGRPERFEAAIVENLAFDRDELIGFGAGRPVWRLLSALQGWSAIEVDRAVASELSRLLSEASGLAIALLDDIYHVLPRPVTSFHANPVRLLTPADASLLQRAPPEMRGDGWGSIETMLQQGVAAAAALVAHHVQVAGQTPVWSAGTTNVASLRIAGKLGFTEVARRTYLIPMSSTSDG
jgi:hypothetical protein